MSEIDLSEIARVIQRKQMAIFNQDSERIQFHNQTLAGFIPDLLADLDAARADIERLREQRDKLVEFIRERDNTSSWIGQLDFWEIWEMSKDQRDKLNDLLAEIESEGE